MLIYVFNGSKTIEYLDKYCDRYETTGTVISSKTGYRRKSGSSHLRKQYNSVVVDTEFGDRHYTIDDYPIFEVGDTVTLIVYTYEGNLVCVNLYTRGFRGTQSSDDAATLKEMSDKVSASFEGNKNK